MEKVEFRLEVARGVLSPRRRATSGGKNQVRNPFRRVRLPKQATQAAQRLHRLQDLMFAPGPVPRAVGWGTWMRWMRWMR